MKLIDFLVARIKHIVCAVEDAADDVRAKLFDQLTPEELESRLDHAAGDAGQRLDWRNSIVDLLKLVGISDDIRTRGELAKDFGYDGEFKGSAEDNRWLHQKVLDALAQQNIPLSRFVRANPARPVSASDFSGAERAKQDADRRVPRR